MLTCGGRGTPPWVTTLKVTGGDSGAGHGLPGLEVLRSSDLKVAGVQPEEEATLPSLLSHHPFSFSALICLDRLSCCS